MAKQYVPQLSHVQRMERRKQVSQLFATGLLCSEIAARTGLAIRYVKRLLQEAGFSVRVKRPQTLKIVAQLFDLSKTQSDIAAENDTSRQWVSQVKQQAIEAGIPLPDRSGEAE